MNLRPTRRSARTPLTVALAATAVLVAASCGGGSDDDGGDEAAADGGTRTISDTFLGDVEVPEDPQRIVALWRTGSILADLGVVPVGSLEGEFLDTELTPEQYEPVSDVPTVGSFEGVDIEELIALEPDLIVGMDNGGLEIDYDEVSEVAPTVILEIAEPPDVWANYPVLADVVGQSTVYDERAADLDEQLASIADDHGDVIGQLEATTIGGYAGTYYLDTSKSLSYERVDAAGFGYNDDLTDDPERYSEEFALENLPDLADQDVLFYDVDINGESGADTAALLDAESWQRLPAVEAGHAYPFTSGVIYTFAGAEAQVDDLRAAAEDLAADAR